MTVDEDLKTLEEHIKDTGDLHVKMAWNRTLAYLTSHRERRTIMCSDCEMSFSIQSHVADNYVQVTCPFCGEKIEI